MTAEQLDRVDEVTLPIPLWRPLRWDDLQRLPERDGHRYEILYGSLLVSASPTPWHQLVSKELDRRLTGAAPDDLLVLEAVEIDCGDSVLEPDILVVRRRAVTPAAARFLPADVLLAVEVESPSSRRMDRIAKPSVYAGAGIPAYWRVCLDDPDVPVVVVSRLDAGAYREVVAVRAGDSVTVDLPFPVELRPADLVGPRRRG